MSNWAFPEYVTREFYFTWSGHMRRLKYLRSQGIPANCRKLPWAGYHVYW